MGTIHGGCIFTSIDTRIGINLQVTAVVLQELLRMDTLACPGEFKNNRGRVLHPLALLTLALTGT
jgi:acyl-coenzyme A thioesterase PaaI-like protein